MAKIKCDYYELPSDVVGAGIYNLDDSDTDANFYLYIFNTSGKYLRNSDPPYCTYIDKSTFLKATVYADEVTDPVNDTQYANFNHFDCSRVRVNSNANAFDITFYATTYDTPDTPTTTKYKVSSTLKNCSTDAPDSVDDGTEFTYTYTAKSGYEFKSVTSNVGTVEISSDYKTATVKGTASEDINITATALEPVTIVTDNFIHSSYTPTRIFNDDGETAVTFTADEGYYYSTAPDITYRSYATFQDNTISGTPNSDSTSYSFTLDTDDLSKVSNVYSVTYNANAVEKPQAVINVNILAGDLSNATFTPTTAVFGDSVTITVTATDGYSFINQLPYIEYNGQVVKEKNFTLNDDKTAGTVTLDTTEITNDSNYNVYVYANASKVDVQIPSQLFTIYDVTADDLQKISNKRFTVFSPDSGVSYEPLIDYINNVYTLPIIFTDLPSQPLYLRDVKITDSTRIINKYNYNFDMGSFTLSRHYNNSNDYNNSYYISLPYYGIYTLENNLYLEGEISVTVKINAISGDCVYNFSKNDVVIDSVNTNVKEDLPFVTSDHQKVGNLQSVTNFEVEPAVSCFYHEISNAYSRKDINEFVKNLSYFRSDKILSIKGVSKHYVEMLENELNKGVILNELS